MLFADLLTICYLSSRLTSSLCDIFPPTSCSSSSSPLPIFSLFLFDFCLVTFINCLVIFFPSLCFCCVAFIVMIFKMTIFFFPKQLGNTKQPQKTHLAESLLQQQVTGLRQHDIFVVIVVNIYSPHPL